MRAALIYGAGDVRIETVPDPKLVQPTDAVVRIVRACICGSHAEAVRVPLAGLDDTLDAPTATSTAHFNQLIEKDLTWTRTPPPPP